MESCTCCRGGPVAGGESVMWGGGGVSWPGITLSHDNVT